MAPITVLIPAFNRQDLTSEAVRQLARQTLRPAKILVVDDGSSPPLQVPGAQLLQLKENRGFAAAVNAGIRDSRTPLVAILNNDVTLNPVWLETLAAEFDDSEVSFACGKLYRPDGLLDGTWDLLSRGGLAWRAGSGRPDGPPWSIRRSIAFTSFAAVIIKMEALNEIGLLDESYGSYYEDVEWSLRSALAGKHGIYQPKATGVHLGSATAGKASPYSSRQLLRNHRRLTLQYSLPARASQIAHILLRLQTLRRGQWPTLPVERVERKPSSSLLAAVLKQSELELYRLQQETGMDNLWDWYFRLAGASV